MTNDESKMTKEIRMTNGGRAGFGTVHRAAVGKRCAHGVFVLSDLVIPLSLVIGHWSFYWLKE